MKKALCSAVILLLLSLASYQSLVFAMTSANYQIPTIVSGGGGGTSGSPGYSVTGMIGQSVIGGASSASYSLNGGFWNDITQDTTPPTGTISINSGAATTNSTTVTLTLSCTDASGCSEMQFSNDNTAWSTAEAYATSKTWTLLSGDGTKTVYVKFKDAAGNWSTAFNDTITLDAPPSKPANIDVAQNGVKGELLISWSNPSDADFNHIHIYRSTASGALGTLIADNVTGIKYTDTGLASLTTYYYTVRAVDTAGNESTNTNAQPNEYGLYPRATTLDATPPAVPTGVTAVDATTGGKINLSWTNPTDSDFSMIKIYRSTASGTLGSAVFIGLAISWSNTGLTNGVAYYYTVRAVDTSSNETTNTTQVSATPTAPDTTPPAVPTTGGTPVVNTQAGGTLTISWTNPADSDFAFVRIYRSTTSGVLGNLVYDNVTGTSVTDTGLTNNATYYYTIRSVDTAGNESTNTNQVSGMPTDIQVPKNVTGLTTTLLSNGQIKLDWTRSASTDVNAYNIYYDNGTGTIDYTYANKIGTVQHPTTTWTSGNLTVGTAYKFAVRAEDTAQNEEANASVVASAVPVTDPNAGDVRGYIKVPQIGQKISGSRVTVVADLLTGASIDVKDMRLQYKPASSGSWTDITPADASFPNPDTTYPWFTHWDVTSLATGDYLIRGIATNVNLSTDAIPAYITVTVDNTAPEASEGKNAENEPEKRQDVSASAANKTAIATESGVTELAIPEGALSTDTRVTVTVEAPATKDSLVPSGYGKANEFRDITLDSGQTSLSNNKEAEIVIPYKDDNNDNIIDGTTTKVYDTKVMRYNETTLKWEKLDSVVDTTNKIVKGKTNHFTLFGLLAPPNPTTPGWNLVSVPLYPSPNSASSVFGQTPYVYNPTTNTYTRPSTIQPGIGYWIKGGSNLYATGTETPTTGNFSISLKKGWNMIGNPFRFNVRLSDMKVNYNSTEYTMNQAETNGYLIGTVYPYANGVYQFINASDGGELDPWVGYWILSDKDMTLLVPPTPAQ